MSNWLHNLEAPVHGANPRPREMALTYLVGVLAGIFVVWQGMGQSVALSPVQIVVLFVVALDVVSGIVANATRSTNVWYRQRPLWGRLLFVAVHFAHPLLAVLFLDAGNWTFFWAVYLYTLATTSILLTMPQSESQRPLAFAFYAVGVIGVIYLVPAAPTLHWFAPAFFAKLILAFGVDHYNTQPSAQAEAAMVEGAHHA
jgi:hypothetical protein